MKRTPAVIAVIAALAASGVAPAQAASVDLYMAKGVEQIDGIYIGDFAAVRKTGRTVVGAVGALSSEYVCIKGTVSRGRLRASYYDNGVPAGSFSRAWVGHGARQHIKGMDSVTRGEAATFLQSNPNQFIRACLRQTS